ncbi:MAG: M28 family peptidase [Lachnospiraceae bacterium]|nr:M28 family peptidase [Lachnospiraceae bacterium]
MKKNDIFMRRVRRQFARGVMLTMLAGALLLQEGCSETGGSGESSALTQTEDPRSGQTTEPAETPTPTPEPASTPEETSDPEPTESETEIAAPTPAELPAISPDYDLYGAKAYSYLKELVGNYPYRTCGSDQEKAAGEWIKGKLESFGYEVRRQDFRLIDKNWDNYPDDAIGLDQATEYPVLGTSRNYFCTKPGKTGKILVISAHYDCVDTTGTDDNGSGVAALLELAEHYKNMDPLEYTLLFAFYGSEEPGMMGSVYHVRELMGNGGFENIAGVINIDSIAAGDNLYIHGGMPQEDGTISQYGLAALALKLSDAEGLGMTTHPDTDKIPEKTRVYGSDQFHFAANGKPYVYFEANLYSNTQPDNIPQWYQTADKRVPGGQIMHTEYDNLDTIETLWPGRTRDHLRRFEVLLNLLLPNITDSVLNS